MKTPRRASAHQRSLGVPRSRLVRENFIGSLLPAPHEAVECLAAMALSKQLWHYLSVSQVAVARLSEQRAGLRPVSTCPDGAEIEKYYTTVVTGVTIRRMEVHLALCRTCAQLASAIIRHVCAT